MIKNCLLLLTTSILLCHSSFAQWGQNMPQDDRRFIEVTGSADIEISPDQIELEIILGDDKYKKVNTNLDKTEALFLAVLKKNNIKDEQIVMGGINNPYYWYYWWSYRHNKIQRRSYRIKLSQKTDFMKLMKDLDIDGVSSLRITNSTHNEIQDYREDVKIKAMLAAKRKANYLLESLGENIGKVISIKEINNDNGYRWRNQGALMSNYSAGTQNSESSIANVASIKLRYEILARFEISE